MLFVLITKKKELPQTVWDQIDCLKDSEFLCTVQEKCSGLRRRDNNNNNNNNINNNNNNNN